MTGNLMEMRVSELRALAKEKGLRWYTGFNKEDLAKYIEESIRKHQSVGNKVLKDYSKLKASEMREVARENGLRGWTGLKKAKLEKFLNDKLNTPRSQPTTSKHLNECAKSMLSRGFTVSEVFKVLGLETLKIEMSKPETECEVIDHGNGVLCSGDCLCDFCKDSYLAMYGDVMT